MLFLALNLSSIFLGSTKHLESLSVYILLIGGNLGTLILLFFFFSFTHSYLFFSFWESKYMYARLLILFYASLRLFKNSIFVLSFYNWMISIALYLDSLISSLIFNILVPLSNNMFFFFLNFSYCIFHFEESHLVLFIVFIFLLVFPASSFR